MTKLKFCLKCQEYTLDDVCPHGHGKTVSNQPPRYSPQDHYGEYRRKLKKLSKKVKS